MELDALAGQYDVTLERSRWTALTPLPTLSLDQPEGAIVVEPFDDGLVQIPGVVLHESAPVAGRLIVLRAISGIAARFFCPMGLLFLLSLL